MSNVIPVLNILPTSIAPIDVEFFDRADVLSYGTLWTDDNTLGCLGSYSGIDV